MLILQPIDGVKSSLLECHVLTFQSVSALVQHPLVLKAASTECKRPLQGTHQAGLGNADGLLLQSLV